MKENYRAWSIDINVPHSKLARPEPVEWIEPLVVSPVEPFPKEGILAIK